METTATGSGGFPSLFALVSLPEQPIRVLSPTGASPPVLQVESAKKPFCAQSSSDAAVHTTPTRDADSLWQRWHVPPPRLSVHCVRAFKGAFTPNSPLLLHFLVCTICENEKLSFFSAGLVHIHICLFVLVQIIWWFAQVNQSSAALQTRAQ